MPKRDISSVTGSSGEPRYTLAEHHKMHGKHPHDRFNCDGCDSLAKWAVENFIRDELPGLLADALRHGERKGSANYPVYNIALNNMASASRDLAAKVAELRSERETGTTASDVLRTLNDLADAMDELPK